MPIRPFDQGCAAIHSTDVVAVAPRMRCCGVEVGAGALRAVPVAHVDERDGVPPRDEEVGDLDVPRRRLVVRRLAHDRREAPVGECPLAGGSVHVERQPHAVPHRDQQVLGDDDAVRGVYAGITGRTMWDGWSASA